jgi:hypothetical protein
MSKLVVGPWPASGPLREDRVLSLATCQYGGRKPLRRLERDLGPSPSVEQLAAHFGVTVNFLTQSREDEPGEHAEFFQRMRGG